MDDEKYSFENSLNRGGGDKYILINKQPLSQGSTVPSDRKNVDSLGATQICEKSKDNLERANEPRNAAGATGPSGGTDEDNLQEATGPSGGTDGGFLHGATGLSGRTDEDYLPRRTGPSEGTDRDSSKVATSPGVPDYRVTKPFTLPKVWTDYFIKIFKGEKSIHCIDAKKVITPPKMQFLYHHAYKELQKRVQPNYNARFHENEMIIYVEKDPLKSDEDLLHDVAALLDIEDTLDETRMTFKSTVTQKIYSEIQSHPPDKYPYPIAFYQGEDRNDVWIVGHSKTFAEVKRKFNNIKKNVQTEDIAGGSISDTEEGFRQLNLDASPKQDPASGSKHSGLPKSKKENITEDGFEFPVEEFTSQLWQTFETEFKSHFADQKPSLSVKLNPAKTCLIVKGLLDSNQFASMLNKCCMKLRFADGEKDVFALSLLLKPAVVVYIQSELRDIRCVWKTLEDRIRVYGINDADAVKGVKVINGCLKSKKWGREFRSAITDAMASKQVANMIEKLLVNETSDGYVVAGTDDAIRIVLELIDDEQLKQKSYGRGNITEQIPPSLSLGYIIENCHDKLNDIFAGRTVRYNVSQVKNWGTDLKNLELIGPEDEVKEAKKKIFEMMKSSTSCEYVTEDQSYKMLVKPEDDGKWLKSLEKKHKSKIGILNGYKVKRQQRFKDHSCWIRNVSVHLVQGSITDIESDMILLPVNKDLEPCDIGKAIMKSGGNELEKALNQLKFEECNGKALDLGKVIFRNVVGDLPCQYVGYYVLEAGKSKLDKTVAEAMFKEILDFVIQNLLSTVALPLQITGAGQCIKGFARSLVSSLEERKIKHRLCSYLCAENGANIKKLQEKLRKELLDSKFLELNMEDLQILEEKGPMQSPIKMTVVEGSLMDEHIAVPDVMIVNSADTKLELSKGYIAQQILEKGGNSIKIECKSKFPKGLCNGEVVTTGPGNLRCKKICHVVLYPNWNEVANISEKVLKCVVLKTLREAESNKCSTVAFPGLGTGTLDYPNHKVAEIMIDCVDSYGSQKPSTCIREVQFVLWKQDNKTMEAFKNRLERQKYFMENVKFIELTPDIDTHIKWLEAIYFNGVNQLKIQLLPKSARKYDEETKVVVYVVESQQVQGEHLNYAYRLDKDHYKIYITCTNDHDFKTQVEKCLNFTSKERLLSVSFEFDGINKFRGQGGMKLAHLMKGIILGHRVDYANLVKIYFDLDDSFIDQCWESEMAEASLPSKIWKGLSSFIGSDVPAINWSKKECDIRNHYLAPAVQISVVSGNVESAKQTMLEIQSKCQPTDKDKTDKGRSFLDKGKCFVDKGRSLIDKKCNDKKSGTTTSTNENIKSQQLHQQSEAANLESTHLGANAEPTSKNPSMMQPEGNKSQSDKKWSVVGEVTPEVLPSKKVNVISRMSADVNPGILKLEAGLLGKTFKDLERNCKVSITQSNGGCKIEGDCLNQIQKVKLHLENIGKENGQVMDDPDQSDSSFTDDFQNFISVPVSSKIKYQAYMHFYGDDLCRKHGIQMDFPADALIISGIALPKNDEMEKKIRGQVEHINQMTETDIPFKQEELQVMKVNKRKLEDEYKDGFFYIDEENLILFVVDDYNYEQRTAIKHKVKILLGQIQETKTRRNRRFAAGDIEVEKQEASEQYNSLQASFSSEDHNTSFRNHGNGSNFSEKKQFTTKEGIIVYVYSQSILQLDVDCIVNAANERLGHGAGVAAAIARAAGYELEREGKDYIRQHGEIPVGECCHTTAGKLPYEYVIHTVGPRWNNNMTFDEQTQCKKELQNAVASCFYEADKLRMRSIGVPSVSAGIFGMPPYICAKQYCEAVINYSQQRTWNTKSSTLKEIHFIDMNDDMCRQIADVFSKCGELSGKEAGLSGGSKPSSSRHSFSKSSYSRSLSHGSYDSPSLPHGSYDRNEDEAISNSKKIVFRPCSWITIHLLQSSITEVKNVSVVVSPENLGFKHQGRISKDILAKADDEYRDRLEIMKDKPTAMKSVFTLDCTEGMPWKHVVYAIAPRWGSEYVKNNQQFKIDLKDTMVNILNEVQMKGAKSLAVPLLGTAMQGMQTPIDTCCCAMLDGIQSIINKGTRAKNWNLDLWIVTTDPTAIHTFENMLDTKFGSKSPKTQQDAESSKLENKTTDDKALDEDCCICMDKITDPKWLPCKHVFCTDCIDQQFKFKPACPQCGAVHGVVTGDQPYGTMRRALHNYSLPGYHGCKTIAITYSFPSGRQSEEHPNPGKFYTGIERTGYLPDNKKGRLVASLLEVAFDRRLVFTIGRSVTTGHEGVITWNDIHHKTNKYGGQQSFGYPDETYLDRVMDELAAKGVTEDSV